MVNAKAFDQVEAFVTQKLLFAIAMELGISEQRLEQLVCEVVADDFIRTYLNGNLAITAAAMRRRSEHDN
jgi:hypothetical protein